MFFISIDTFATSLASVRVRSASLGGADFTDRVRSCRLNLFNKGDSINYGLYSKYETPAHRQRPINGRNSHTDRQIEDGWSGQMALSCLRAEAQNRLNSLHCVEIIYRNHGPNIVGLK